MPIKSYLVFPQTGAESELIDSISTLDNCSIIPANNNKICVLVTDTQTEREEELVLSKIQAHKAFHHLIFISGFTTNQYEKGTI